MDISERQIDTWMGGWTDKQIDTQVHTNVIFIDIYVSIYIYIYIYICIIELSLFRVVARRPDNRAGTYGAACVCMCVCGCVSQRVSECNKYSGPRKGGSPKRRFALKGGSLQTVWNVVIRISEYSGHLPLFQCCGHVYTRDCNYLETAHTNFFSSIRKQHISP